MLRMQINDHGQAVEVAEGGNVNDNRFTVNLSGLTLVAILSLTVVIGACGLVMGLNIAKMDEMTQASLARAKEAKQVQTQLMYANAIMLREGLVQPGDMVYGPEGNLEYRQHELKRKEK